MGDEGTTIGTWFNPREQKQILEPFDEALEEYGIESRSKGIKRAMRAYTAIMEIMNDQSWEFDAGGDERVWIRAAMRNEIQRVMMDE